MTVCDSSGAPPEFVMQTFKLIETRMIHGPSHMRDSHLPRFVFRDVLRTEDPVDIGPVSNGLLSCAHVGSDHRRVQAPLAVQHWDDQASPAFADGEHPSQAFQRQETQDRRQILVSDFVQRGMDQLDQTVRSDAGHVDAIAQEQGLRRNSGTGSRGAEGGREVQQQPRTDGFCRLRGVSHFFGGGLLQHQWDAPPLQTRLTRGIVVDGGRNTSTTTISISCSWCVWVGALVIWRPSAAFSLLQILCGAFVDVAVSSQRSCGTTEGHYALVVGRCGPSRVTAPGKADISWSRGMRADRGLAQGQGGSMGTVMGTAGAGTGQGQGLVLKCWQKRGLTFTELSIWPDTRN